MDIRKQFDPGSWVVMFVTFVLFVTALFVKGLSHDLLLEAGVFLVSVKLIMMAYKNAVASQRLHEELGEIRSLLRRLEKSPAPADSPQPAGSRTGASPDSSAAPRPDR
jgi:hypothetical protein